MLLRLAGVKAPVSLSSQKVQGRLGFIATHCHPLVHTDMEGFFFLTHCLALTADPVFPL